jgi:hypothetical protein
MKEDKFEKEHKIVRLKKNRIYGELKNTITGLTVACRRAVHPIMSLA